MNKTAMIFDPFPGPYHREGKLIFDRDGNQIALVSGNSGVSHVDATAALMTVSFDMRSVLDAYHDWETDVVFLGKWEDGVPSLTADLFDRLMEIQAMRNAAFAKIRGEKS